MKKKNKILPATQELIDLFVSMPSEVQDEFRKYINDTEPLLDWGVELDKLEWDIDLDKLEWDLRFR